MKDIILSKKHGVNPTILLCFWCGKTKNEIALLGKLKGDVEAPRNMILNYEPCEDCSNNMSKGITLIEATLTGEPGQPEMGKGIYPTGKWAVLTEDATKRLIVNKDMLDDILKKKKCYIASEAWEEMGF